MRYWCASPAIVQSFINSFIIQAYSASLVNITFCNLTDNTPPANIPIYTTALFNNSGATFADEMWNLNSSLLACVKFLLFVP